MLESVEQKNAKLEEEMSTKEKAYQQLEAQSITASKDFEAGILALQEDLDKVQSKFAKAQEALRKKEATLNQMTQERNKVIMQLASSENEKYDTIEKYGKLKKYIKEVEDQLIKKDEKIKMLKMEKQNNELVANIQESGDTRLGLGNELEQLDYEGSGSSAQDEREGPEEGLDQVQEEELSGERGPHGDDGCVGGRNSPPLLEAEWEKNRAANNDSRSANSLQELEGHEGFGGNEDLPFAYVGEGETPEVEGLKLDMNDLPELDDEDQQNSPYGGHYDGNYGSTGGHYPTVPTPTNGMSRPEAKDAA